MGPHGGAEVGEDGQGFGVGPVVDYGAEEVDACACLKEGKELENGERGGWGGGDGSVV